MKEFSKCVPQKESGDFLECPYVHYENHSQSRNEVSIPIHLTSAGLKIHPNTAHLTGKFMTLRPDPLTHPARKPHVESFKSNTHCQESIGAVACPHSSQCERFESMNSTGALPYSLLPSESFPLHVR